MPEEKRTTAEEARRVGDVIGVDWERFDLEQFRTGMDVEFEHGARDPQTDVTGDDPIATGKIALAHMKEFPDTTSGSSAWKPRQSATGASAGVARDLRLVRHHRARSLSSARHARTGLTRTARDGGGRLIR